MAEIKMNFPPEANAENPHFRAGFVALVGRANVGKSTLTNRIAGQKLTIVSPKPQTTQETVRVIDAGENYQMILTDTPGVQNRQSRLNKIAAAALLDADLVVWVVEVLAWRPADAKILSMLEKITAPIILVINKIDRLKSKNELLAFIQTLGAKTKIDEIFPLSAFQSKDVARLKSEIQKCLPVRPPIFPQTSGLDHSEAFMIRELIREQLMKNLHKELPYRTQVAILRHEKNGDRHKIWAQILVVKPSQKTIVIGKSGAMIKKIGTRARENIARFYGGPIFLKLWVAVEKSAGGG